METAHINGHYGTTKKASKPRGDGLVQFNVRVHPQTLAEFRRLHGIAKSNEPEYTHSDFFRFMVSTVSGLSSEIDLIDQLKTRLGLKRRDVVRLAINELANRHGIKASRNHQIEAAVTYSTMCRAQKLCDELKCSVDELMEKAIEALSKERA